MSNNILLFPINKQFTGKCGKIHKVEFKKILIGKGVFDDLPIILKEFYGNSQFLLVGDKITTELFVNKIVNAFSLPPNTCVINGATMEEVQRVATQLFKGVIPVAIGGGSVIDVVKLASYIKNIPFVSVPTSPSHDGIISGTASILVNGKKTTQKAKPPEVALLDTVVLASAPKRLISAGYGDVLVKFTSLKDWQLSNMDTGEFYCEDSVSISDRVLEQICTSLQSSGLNVTDLAYALVNSGASMVIAGSSRPESGSEHIVSHYLDTHSPRTGLHGEQVGLLTLLISHYYVEKAPEIWWTQPSRQPEEIRRFLSLAGLPHTLAELGIQASLVIEALQNASTERPDKYTILHKFPPNKNEATDLVIKSKLFQMV
ncbi:hypothetical protein B9Q13_01855 [Candidatus Marsarchaeota G2 archaeon ECH_B_SAG-G16]|jgi:glycerol-1-phosphate dehydrogenase [NAD(P)+]|uniref:Glycerol-1-phosphate dehydrogenase [NAD(P)+] n=4 Tax=Candidatus Marsarchaeota TaxID=1978152 RepID=A0A2R6C3M1_9ARCH|nr:MAG: hypothetical protein B9Q13_01855 [Candidatus Marsarchaeota G2 archaeon ECH_B_SAG-G16]